MKKLLFALLLMLVGSLTASAALITTTGKKPTTGNGNSGKPYEIWTAEELRWFVHYENTRHWFPDDHAKLMCDIDLSSICGPDKGSWIPLGASEENGADGYYYGNFDGNDHTISGIYIDGKDASDAGMMSGFFGLIYGSNIRNLTVEGDIVNASKASCVGGLIGQVAVKSFCVLRKSNYSNCESKMDIWLNGKGEEAVLKHSGLKVGGLVGTWENIGDVNNCVFSGNIHFTNASSLSSVGALIGEIDSYKQITLTNCSAVTSSKLPFIDSVKDHWRRLYVDVYNCVTNGYIFGRMELTQEEIGYVYGAIILVKGSIYGAQSVYGSLVGSPKIKVDLLNNIKCDEEEMFTNGYVCHTINELAGSRIFGQTIGTDRMPFPEVNKLHETVYKVKEYTKCGNDDYVWAYSNKSFDITDKRQHTFVAEELYCTACHQAVNPDYGIAKDGEGYYLAGSADDVKWLWNLVNVTGMTDAKIRLTADIDMENEAIEPLARYAGILDGQGHTLSNIHIDCSGIEKVGLVGNLEGTIRNLTLSGTVEGTHMQYLGAFAGYVDAGASISNVRNDCTVKTKGTISGTMNMYIGGVAGYVDGDITYCINNAPVVDASVAGGILVRFMAGVAGMVTDGTAHHLANNAVVGAQNGASQVGLGAPVVNINQTNSCSPSYYVNDISNPGLKIFFSHSPNATDIAVSSLDVGSGRLAWLLSGSKDYSAEDAETCFFGQTVGTDLVPYPFVSETHKGVYNARHYYTCDSYSDYSNSPNDGKPLAHNWNTVHYCKECCVIDPNYMQQDAQTKAYLISTPEQYNVFVTAVDAAYKASKPMRYASASIQDDLDFSSTSVQCFLQLHGRLHGNGHRITFGSGKSNYAIATSVGEDGIIEHLDVVYPSNNFYGMVGINLGQIVGCNITRGVPTGRSAGLVIDCSGELQNTNNLYGRFTRCLIKMFTMDGANNYRLYNSNAAYNEYATYTEIPLSKGETGELAYTLSHDSGCCEWGQALSTDTDPRIYYGQTPTSDTYVTSLTTYSVENPDGKVEYMNAGMALEAAPGYYKVCQDTESWTARPAYNFIIDNGDGTYTAEHINIDPTVQNYLPISVQAEKLTFQSADSEGKLAAKDYGFGEILSLVFPVDMPVSNVNGHVHLFDGYDALNNTLVFTSSLDDGDCTIPANTPVLVKTYGGSLLNADLTNVTVSPMTEAGYSELENVRHLTNYQQQTLPTGKVVEDGAYVLYYVLGGNKATLPTADANTVNQFNAFFRLPYVAGSDTQNEINVALVEDRELKTSRIVERDIFDIPYGSIDDNTEWHKVNHLSDPNVFYGNDINKDIFANISAYDFLYIHGKAGQKYYFYFNGSDATEVVIDNDGDAFIDLNDHRVGIGDVYLRGIRLAEGETVPDDAFAKVYKYLEEGLVLYGYGDFSDDLKGYPFYDATGVKCGITLNLDNPNAMVVGGNVKGVYNRIEKSENVMQGFTAEKLRLTDGGDFCYDYSVKCPDVTFTRYDIPEGVRYVTFVLPFAVKYVKGMHEYIDCDGKNVYFNTPEDGIIDAYLPIVIDMQEYEGNTITITGENFVALSPNGTFNVAPSPSSQYDLKYGFVTKRQESTPLTHEELADYNVYCFSLKSYKFVRAVNTFSISPFRAFFMLPKAARTRGDADSEAEIEALDIVLDGEEITTGVVDLDFDFDVDFQSKRYNMLGQPVNSNYHGIVIQGGKKIVIK